MAYRKGEIGSISIYSLKEYIKPDKLQPVYFFYGVDTFAIENGVKEIEKVAAPFLMSDFDKEIISAEKKQKISEIIDLAYAFPFGNGKKLMIVKNFENISDKKNFVSYIENPSETTILVLIYNGKINNLASGPYKLLAQKKYLFEAKELKGKELINWLILQAGSLELNLSAENALALIDIVGSSTSLLQMQLHKFKNFLGNESEISLEIIEKLSSATKEHNIFELQEALGRGSKKKSLQIIYNLLESGQELTMIIAMLAKFVSVAAQSIELSAKHTPDDAAAKAIGISRFYYKKCKSAAFFKSHTRLKIAGQALFNADLLLKTTSTGNKTIATKLISEIFINE